jgi:hypothetical protein
LASDAIALPARNWIAKDRAKVKAGVQELQHAFTRRAANHHPLDCRLKFEGLPSDPSMFAAFLTCIW